MAFKPLSINERVELTSPFKIMMPLSPIIDVISGSYVEGSQGEMILNGGVMNFTAFAGEGNTMKSTVVNSIILRIMARRPWVTTFAYDTECNFSPARMRSLALRYPELANEDWFTGTMRYSLTSKIETKGDKWFDTIRDFGKTKEKAKDQWVTTPFLNLTSAKKENLRMLFPSLLTMDSISEFQTEEAEKKVENTEIDDSGLSTYYMNDGMHKTRMITELPKVLIRSGQYLLTTVHVASTINISNQPERKRLGYMRQGYKMKKVPSNFEFLTHHTWEITSAKAYLSSDKSGPYYPDYNTDGSEARTDLYEVVIQGLRNKTGLSGISVALLVSQSQGVLWDLSHFDCIKNFDFGLEKSGHSFRAVFYPSVVIMRTTARQLLDEDKRLARAVELLCELCLFYMFHNELKNHYRLKPEDIYRILSEKGYDWDKILDTRGYWMFKEEEEEFKPTPYLSGFDLLRMTVGEITRPDLLK